MSGGDAVISADNTYVISDVHGQFDALMEMLKKINFGYDDELYIIGDLIDRGDKSLECIRWAMEQDNVLVMIGNHELMYLDIYLHDGPALYNTIKEAREQLSKDEQKAIADWIMDMPECKLVTVNGQRFYLNHTQPVSNTYFNEELTDRMFPDYARYKTYYDLEIPQVISIFGHIPTIQMRAWYQQKRSNKIWKNKSECIYDIDCGAGYPEDGGCLGCLRLNDLKEFYVNI